MGMGKNTAVVIDISEEKSAKHCRETWRPSITQTGTPKETPDKIWAETLPRSDVQKEDATKEDEGGNDNRRLFTCENEESRMHEARNLPLLRCTVR